MEKAKTEFNESNTKELSDEKKETEGNKNTLKEVGKNALKFVKENPLTVASFLISIATIGVNAITGVDATKLSNISRNGSIFMVSCAVVEKIAKSKKGKAEIADLWKAEWEE